MKRTGVAFGGKTRMSTSLLRTTRFILFSVAGVLAAVLASSCAESEPDTDHNAESATGIGYVQRNSAVPHSPQSSLSVPYLSVQSAGNLNVIVVGWNDTVSSVSSVTDTRGNVYQLAIGPTRWTNALSQSIYYAKNIAAAAAGAN